MVIFTCTNCLTFSKLCLLTQSIKGICMILRVEINHVPDFITTQFTFGHGKFRLYFRRFHIKVENGFECTCGGEQTVEHLLFDCPIFGNRRFLP
jgi:hypothetical protein